MLDLSPSETLARDHLMNLVIVGRQTPINVGTNGFDFDFNKPNWFDADKYKLGQMFFHENRAGILMTNMAGLILLLSVPYGLRILHGTGQSSTPATAQNRYVDTILHTLSWYDYPLDDSTKSWDSLKTVRKLHNVASADSERKGIGFISQDEVSITTFGFVGFAIIRPHLFGINGKDRAKREGILHMWAVINYMLGVKDEFNICLLPLEAVEIEFDIIMRNLLSPYMQVESPLFKQMLGALIDGMQSYLPLSEYESQLFLTRRAIGIPGYQYDVDLKKERPHRNIFTEQELRSMGVPLFRSPDILLLKVRKRDDDNNSVSYGDADGDQEYAERLRTHFELPETASVRIKQVPRNETHFMASLNANKYKKLSRRAKLYVNLNLSFISTLNNRVTKYMSEQFLSFLLNSMRSQQITRKSKN